MEISPGAAIGIYAKPGHATAPKLVGELSAWLAARGYRALPDAAAEAGLGLSVVLGGDGTMLHAARRLAAAATPILAVHLGTLGFLTETALADLYASLETVLAGGGVTQRRSLLRAERRRRGQSLGQCDALNEVVVGKATLARMVRLALHIDGQLVGRYRADGLIVATPTGSTAYSCSAGGSVLHPELGALLVTPICPHAMGQRPLAVPETAEILVAVDAASDPAFLTVDGQDGAALEPGDEIRCTRSPWALRLVTAAPVNFYQNLRAKLHWT